MRNTANHPAGKELIQELNPESMAVHVNAAQGVSTRGLHHGPFALGGGGLLQGRMTARGHGARSVCLIE